jgi:hypothetical protein
MTAFRDQPARIHASASAGLIWEPAKRAAAASGPADSREATRSRRIRSTIDIRRVVAECDLVVTHGLLTGAEPVFTELGSKVVDIFRLDEHGKIVEHWDVLSPISPTSANGNPEV